MKAGPRPEARGPSRWHRGFWVAILIAFIIGVIPATNILAAQVQVQSPPPKNSMPIAELRTRLYALSQMIQTGRLDEAEQGLATLRVEAGPQPLIDGMD